jgi:formate/nitrite transporter
LLRNWCIVYAGNFVGSFGTAVLLILGRQYAFGGGAVGLAALQIAVGKVQLGFVQAVALGVLCNALVCLAVWMAYGARSTVDKIAAIIFPISAFVAAGFEHSIANMYFVPYGLLIQALDPGFVAESALDVTGLTWSAFLLGNLLPVTIGNIIGGGLLVAGVYWSVFLRNKES